MKEWLYTLALATIVAGCAWTPERANPYDPDSPLYVDPPIPNSPPVITSIRANTQCVNFSTEDQCDIRITARVADADNNVNLDSVVAIITDFQDVTHFFGKLTYNPVDLTWALNRHETELDSSAEQHVGSLITVVATDDSGATAIDSVEFPSLFREYVTLNWPDDPAHCTCPDFRDFSWDRWTGEGQLSAMELRFYFRNFEEVPSLTIKHEALQDTFHTVIEDFVPSDSNSTIFYGWRLFVFDQSGNGCGSASGGFNYRETCNGECGP